MGNVNDSVVELEGTVVDLADVIEYQSDSIVSKTLVDESSTTVTAFALDEGQRISEHAAPHTALVQVLEGTGSITIDGDEHELQRGESIFMPANVPHAVDAPAQFTMLLTMIR
ncbi:cupin domain-containing protein [Natrialba swarupiae]|uniref:Cupin domain-containing protein n=1 Tax=Natrialba swarupiae TaxID=2448032 RepID=A0A5D5AGA9_9EURY|nr:cupin domain-containing protein [Natrialba swarupiae]TYT60796.1 cupin domain-containing protein [Natrialba swarupiae]